MPFFGRNRRRCESTNNIKTPRHHDSPPPYQLQNPQEQPSNPYQAYQNPINASQYGLVPARNPNTLPSAFHRRNQSTPAAQNWTSCTNLPVETPFPTYNRTAEYWNVIGDKFSDVISLIDEEVFPNSQRDVIFTFDQNQWQPPQTPPPVASGVYPQHSSNQIASRSMLNLKKQPPKPSQGQQLATQQRSINVLSKVSLYTNSRLPLQLPPLRLYSPTYPIICLAAKYSNFAYNRPSPAERQIFVDADTRLGTKAMILKSIPIDDMNTIVFAIRGTSLLSPRDWGVNWHTDPVTPAGFLDDPGNLCHRGFLKVAKAMVKPIATRLRTLLEENPSRASCSLVITGHSAGGAVAGLLYAHMMCTSSNTRSELNILTGCFKRVHCITFGSPPITLLPLQKPPERRLQKSVFLSFINEGDPVVRAEKAYVLSLVELLASPSPRKTALGQVWRVPNATLSNAGRLVLLRVPEKRKKMDVEKDEDVSASIVKDEELRGVVFGNPIVHAMEIYARRVEVLAIRSATGRVI